MSQNPNERLPIVDLTSAFTPPANDPLLPEGMSNAAASLRDAYTQNMQQGSFAGRHKILSTLLGTLGGAALGGIAGGMDSNVGAGRGAVLGALMGGVTTPLLERQRKNDVAQSYLTMLPKLTEQQAKLDEMRTKRSAGEFYSRASEGKQGRELFSGLPMDASTAKDLMGDLYGGMAGRGMYEDLMSTQPQESGVALGLSKMSQSNAVGTPSVGVAQALNPQAQAMQAGGLEVDPNAAPMAPLQGSAAVQGAMPTYEGPIIPGSTLKDIATLRVPAVTAGLSNSIDIPAMQSLAALRQGQLKQILDLLPAEQRKILAQAMQAEASAKLANRTNPNLRGGGSSNQDMGPLNAKIKAAGEILSKDSGASPEQVAAALQFLSDTASLGNYETSAQGGSTQGGGRADIARGFRDLMRNFRP